MISVPWYVRVNEYENKNCAERKPLDKDGELYKEIGICPPLVYSIATNRNRLTCIIHEHLYVGSIKRTLLIFFHTCPN